MQTQWREARVDLGRWAGQEVEIEALPLPASYGLGATQRPPAQQANAWRPRKPITAYWADLFIHPREPDRSRPNIVVLLVDTLRRDHVSVYGYGRPTTPQIDALAAEGVRFDRAFSNAPWTDPSVLVPPSGARPQCQPRARCSVYGRSAICDSAC